MTTDPNRGTGRTWRQLEALPDGAAFVVAHSAERRIVQRYVAAMGRSDAIKVLVADHMAEEQLKSGRYTAICVDHAVTDDRIRTVATACRVAQQ